MSISSIGKFFKPMNSRMLKRLVISYVIILLIHFVLYGFLFYSYFSTIMSNQVEKTTITTLKQARDIFDMRLKEMYYLANQISENANIVPFIYNANSNPTYQMYTISTDLKNLEASNIFINNIFLYSRENNVVANNSGFSSHEKFYEKYFSNSNIPEQKLKDLFDNISEQQNYLITLNTPNTDKKEQLLFIKPILGLNDKFSTTLIITMNADSFMQLLRDALGLNKGNVYILDKECNSLVSIEKSDINLNKGTLRTLINTQDTDSQILKIDGSNTLLVNIQANFLNYKFMALVPQDQLFFKTKKIEILIFFSIFIAIAVCLPIAYAFCRLSSRPKKSLDNLQSEGDTNLNMLTNNIDYNNYDSSQEEYINMPDSISNNEINTISNEEKLKKRIEQHIPVLRMNFFMRLLKGSFREEKFAIEMAENTGIQLCSGTFVVMVLKIDNYSEINMNNAESGHELYYFAISSVVVEFCKVIGQSYIVDDSKDSIAVIINFYNNEEMNYDEVYNIAVKTAEYFEKDFKFTFTIGIGNVYNNILEVSKSYIEAKTAIGYKILKGKNTIIPYEKIAVSHEQKYFFNLFQENVLYNALKVGDYNSVYLILTNLMNKVKSEPISMEFANCIYFEMINTTIKILAQFKAGESNELVNNNNILFELLKCETLEELYNFTLDYYKNICDYVQTSKSNDDSGMKKKVIDYTKQNYCDSNFSLNQLADHFSVTSSYMSRFFKSQTSCNFIDYLHGLRLEKAKELMLTTSKNLAEIAEATGYINSHSFIRTFKKYEGITPGRFREIKNNVKENEN